MFRACLRGGATDCLIDINSGTCRGLAGLRTLSNFRNFVLGYWEISSVVLGITVGQS